MPQVMKELLNPTTKIMKTYSNGVLIAAKENYEKALKKCKSGYNIGLKYTKSQSKKPENRNRTVFWFNPTSTKSVSRWLERLSLIP